MTGYYTLVTYYMNAVIVTSHMITWNIIEDPRTDDII